MTTDGAHLHDDLSSDPPSDGKSSSSNTKDKKNINKLLDEGYLEIKQRRVHRAACVWTLGATGIILIIFSLLPLEYIMWSIAFKTTKINQYKILFEDKFYLFVTTMILITSAVPLTISIAIVRMVSSNKTLRENDDTDDNQTKEISGIVSPIFDFLKNLILLSARHRQ